MSLRQFLIGSSIFVTIFPMLYVGMPMRFTKVPNFQYEYAVIALPIYYGLMNVIGQKIFKNISNKQTRMVAIGALTGMILSLIGHFGFRLPENLFKMEIPHMVHVYAVALYSFIYGIILYNVDVYLK